MIDAPTMEEDARYFSPVHRGENYRKFLGRIHLAFNPKNYLEIGFRKGASLALSQAPTVAVDPNPMLPADFLDTHPHVQTVIKTSDDFFADCDVKELMGGAVDFAFLDGLHHAEALLRDFANTERVAAPDSVFVLHDCIPTDLGMTRRNPRDAFEHARNGIEWAGDVWKIIPILRKYRPNLKMCFLDAPPTGLVLVTDLDPSSTVIFDRFNEFAEEMDRLDLGAIGVADYVAGLGVRPTTSVQLRSDI